MLVRGCGWAERGVEMEIKLEVKEGTKLEKGEKGRPNTHRSFETIIITAAVKHKSPNEYKVLSSVNLDSPKSP